MDMVYGPGQPLPLPLSSGAIGQPRLLTTPPGGTVRAMGNQTPSPRLPGLNAADQNDAKLMKAAKQFEAIFIHQLLDQMDKTVDRSEGMLHGGPAEDTFRGMLNQEVASKMADHPGGSGLGLADTVYKQLSAQMKVNNQVPQIPGVQPLPTRGPSL